MEFKKRLVKRRKNRKAEQHKNAGYQRIVIRGRKRWIKPTAKDDGGAAPPADETEPRA